MFLSSDSGKHGFGEPGAIPTDEGDCFFGKVSRCSAAFTAQARFADPYKSGIPESASGLRPPVLLARMCTEWKKRDASDV
jgi:hypothetical protein